MLFSGYIAFSSIEYEPLTVFVATHAKSSERVIGEYTIKTVALGKRATGITLKNRIYTSTLAKTFFDCFYNPVYWGGYSEVTKAFTRLRDWTGMSS